MTRRLTLGVMLAAAAGCGGGSSDVCGKLGKAPSCDGSTVQKCTDAVASAKAADATCEPQLTALLACIAKLDLSCTGSTSIAAVGDGMFGGGMNSTQVSGYSVVVSDSKCDVYRRGLEACRTCPEAAGAKTPEALGVGDACTGSATPCASGLTCQGGICTKSCSVNDDCKARADGCRLQYQYPNVCAMGRCTRGCGDRFLCETRVSSASQCLNGACTL